MNRRAFFTSVVIIGVFVTAAGFSAGASTYGLFFESESTSGTIQAATSFSGGPPTKCAFDDVNSNGRWDDGEPAYREDELYSFDNRSVALVIPAECGEIRNSSIDITAGSISADVDFRSERGSLSLTSADGGISIQNQQLLALDTVSVSSSEATVLNGTSVIGVGDVSVNGRSISARNSEIGSWIESVTLSARQRGGGVLDATNASVTSLFDDITFKSNGDMSLDQASLFAEYGDITAGLRGGTTLFVDGAFIDDLDDTLIYTPNGATVNGSPAYGSVRSKTGGSVQKSVGTFSTPTNSSTPTVPEPPIDWEQVGDRLNVSVSLSS